jgi:hypothetical protein
LPRAAGVNSGRSSGVEPVDREHDVLGERADARRSLDVDAYGLVADLVVVAVETGEEEEHRHLCRKKDQWSELLETRGSSFMTKPSRRHSPGSSRGKSGEVPVAPTMSAWPRSRPTMSRLSIITVPASGRSGWLT